MKLKQMIVMLALVALALPVASQMGLGPQVPTLSGVWHPVVGSGAGYERTMSANGSKMQLEITVVGKEDVAGKTAYWMEIAMNDPRMGGEMLMKSLQTVGDNGVASSRMIMQMPGQQPMEMDSNTNMPGRNMRQSTPADAHDKMEVVGTESVTVPAGTFSCEHLREKDGSSDVWISNKVSPWSLVKYQDSKSTMVLTKVITDAKDRITGTPTKFDPMQIMRNRMGQQGQQPQ
jgi:hypothetical protein